MTDLNPKARALISSSRSALRATAADQARIEIALRARLGVAALPADKAVSGVSSGAAWHGVAGIALGVGALAVVAFLALRPTMSPKVMHANSAATTVAPPQARSTETAAGPVTIPQARSAAPTATPALQPRAAVTTSSHAADRLAREIALLSRATSELRAGDAQSALNALAEHQRKFPTGVLSEERRAAKAQALCVLGRVREGRAELARLAPQSPEAARAEQLCAPR